MIALLQKLKNFKPGDEFTTEDINCIHDCLKALAMGENIRTFNIQKGQGEGEVLLKAAPQKSGGGGTSTVLGCAGFIVSLDGTTIQQDQSSVAYAGAVDVGYTTPTLVSGTITGSGTELVWVKISYSAVDTTSYGTAWQLDDVEFDFGTSRPSNVVPTYDWGTSTWNSSGEGEHYSDWATIEDGVVIASFGGGIILNICGEGEVTVMHGCTLGSGFTQILEEAP